jgi:hypothetical protein
MNDLLLKLFQRLHVNVEAEPVSKSRGHVLNIEVAAFGYTLAPDLINAVSSLSDEAYGTLRNSTISALAEMSGSHVNHQSLFKGFPYSTPDKFDYMHRRVMEHIQNTFFYEENSNHLMLTCGHVIDPTIFPDVEQEFGACPVCQFQVQKLKDDSTPKYDFSSITPFKILHKADDDFIVQATTKLVARNSSLSADERRFFFKTINNQEIANTKDIYR